jgi:hypothetical protein
MRAVFLLVAGLAVVAPRAARAQSAKPEGGTEVQIAPGASGRDIVVVTEGSRSTRNILALSGVAAAALAFGGIGLYYNLDARDAANQVTTTGPVGEPWTKADQATYDRANSSSTKAEVFYGVGGACAIAVAVAYMVTAPPSETTVIHPHATAVVAPTRGGAVVAGVWRF